MNHMDVTCSAVLPVLPEQRFCRYVCDTDCMEPFMHYGDIVVVDTANTKIIPGVFLLKVDDFNCWRRLNPLCGDGQVEVICDNHAYVDEICNESLVKSKMVGRVIAVFRMEMDSYFSRLVHEVLSYKGVWA